MTTKPIPELTEAEKKRFWSKVDKRGPEECWPWNGCKNKAGYGQFHVRYRQTQASRIAALLTHGNPPQGEIYACHQCDNVGCVNPRHIFWGSPSDNQQDMIKKERDNRLRGERHPSSKITSAIAKKIRQRYEYRKITLKALGDQFGISFQAVWLIIKGHRWSDAG